MSPKIGIPLLVPMLYLVGTRMNSLKALVSNAATAWIPGVATAYVWSGNTFSWSVGAYALSYLAFVSIYEVGYFVNDTLGTRRDETPRHRLKGEVSGTFSVAFVAIRLATFVAIAAFMSFPESWPWVAACGALLALIVLHNWLASSALKAVTFIQMSALRFSIPILPFVPAPRSGDVLLLGLLHFAYPRFITYLEAKGRLRIPERRTARYALGSQVLMAPAFAVLCAVTGSWLPLGIWVYYTAFQAGRLFLTGGGQTADATHGHDA